MYGKTVAAGLMLAWLGVAGVSAATAAQLQDADGGSGAPIVYTDGSAALAAFPSEAAAAPTRITVPMGGVQAFGRADGVASVPPGTTVYRNEIDPSGQLWSWNPGVNRRMADDLVLAGGACDRVVYYSLAVYAPTSPYNVVTALWTGDPCKVGSTEIAGSRAVFSGVAAGDMRILEATFAPLSVPATVWLAATFSTANSGWIFAEKAEVGSTADLYSQVHPTACSPATCCQLWFAGVPYAGFWATINCDVTQPPNGACCNGATCAETTEAQCTAGTWKGPFTTCDPNPCLPGACCTGNDLTTCTDTTEAGCANLLGWFHPQATCAQDPCDQGFLVYRNDQELQGVFTIANGTLVADDLTMGPGAPCQLAGFELDVFGLSGSGSFDVTAELWTHDAETDGPEAPIPGTTTVFRGLRDGAMHRLVAGPFSGIALPGQAWMVVSTSTPNSGWLIGGEAIIGSTDDIFAIYNDPGYPPNTWAAFDFQDPTVWSGFRANAWCYGSSPTGACCNSAAGTCIDGAAQLECEGRWAVDATCGSEPFDPQCGTNACCTLFGCGDMPIGDCLGMGGEPAPGSFCAGITCPRRECIGASGDCFSVHGTPGCEDAFCCGAVCTADPPCCTSTWDAACAETARSLCPTPPPDNDHCANAEAIAGKGEFNFENISATMDGPLHEECIDANGEKRIAHDVWFCWTSPCTDTIYVRTCDLTTIDTKLAVYDACLTCPPTDASLLDCNDDYCGFGSGDGVQSQLTFDAAQDGTYLIRVGTFPGAEGGRGKFAITCGPPVEPACPGTGDCCADNGTPGCSNDLCCRVVCLCDAFCCEVEWDESCARMGPPNNIGCGAMLLCPNLCGAGTCPDNPVVFVDPPNGVVDARQPYPPANPANRQGIDTIKVQGVPGIDNITCWDVCETAQDGARNNIAEVIDNGNGTFDVKLERSITTGAVTTITYRGKSGGTYKAKFTSHPANVDGDSASGPVDILGIIDVLNGVFPARWGNYSADVDHSGMAGPADILRVIDLLNGADEFDPWLGVSLPQCGACCP